MSRFYSLLVFAFVFSLGALLLFASGLGFESVQTPPIKMGTSGGDVKDRTSSFCCSGTLGAVVSKNGVRYILSNNHVLARSGSAAIGEDISQPGLVDTNCGTTHHNVVADLSQVAKLGATTNADAALARVRSGMVTTSGAILGVGVPSKTPATAVANMHVAKAGRTTQLTCAFVGATNVSVKVEYETKCGGGSTFTESYKNQILINSSKFSAAGDSGSLIVSARTAQPVGLLFAGSSSVTIGNRIQDVSNALGGFSFVGGGNHAVSCPSGSAAATPTQALTEFPAPSAEAMNRALLAKESVEERLMVDDSIQAVGVGSSEDAAVEPAVVVVVDQARYHGGVPDNINGVKTRVIRSDKIRAFGWNEPARGSCKPN